jgi:N-acetylmuramoyl-L-alanine amidase
MTFPRYLDLSNREPSEARALAEACAKLFRDNGAITKIIEDDGSIKLEFAFLETQDHLIYARSFDPLPTFTSHISSTQASRSDTPWRRLITQLRNRTDLTGDQKIASLSQWILESARGTSPLATKHSNFGGLKYRARMEGYATPVDYEAADGEGVYCKFASEDAFITGYWHFIASGPYSGWEEYQHNAAGYIRFIAPTYAADSSYISKVLGLFAEAEGLLALVAGRDRTDPRGTRAGETRLAVVVGHNSVAQGATATTPIGRSEFDFNNVVANAMVGEAAVYNIAAKRFNRRNHDHYEQEIEVVYDEVDSWGADCAVELHFNSYDSPTATGTEMLHAPGSARGKALALDLKDEVRALLELPLRNGGSGVKALQRGDRGYSSVVASATPTVLIEPFFGSNSGDCLKVASVGEAGLARAYLRAVRDWATSAA